MAGTSLYKRHFQWPGRIGPALFVRIQKNDFHLSKTPPPVVI